MRAGFCPPKPRIFAADLVNASNERANFIPAPVISPLLIVWLLTTLVQLFALTFLYARTVLVRVATQPVGRPHPRLTVLAGSAEPPDASVLPTPDEASPGITVIVCARNERENLIELLPLLNAQNYPRFDVLVMDDRSTDGTDAYLDEAVTELTRIRYRRIDREHESITPKKYALTVALEEATYPTVLLTDADCRPASADWLARMVAPFDNPDTQIVLGFSPYEHRPGLLNALIRAETLFTAVQYVSLALAGRPYMGVGRNLAYRTDLFFRNRGFYTHKHVVGGDDDLFINEVATARNTAVCLDPAAFTWSKPKETWADWRLQKRRHLNVGKYYRPGHKLRLGLLTGSHVLTWALGFVVGMWVIWLAISGQRNALLNPLPSAAAGLFGLRLLLFWGLVGRISYRLGHTVHWALMPLADAGLAVYYGVAGTTTLLTRRTKRIYWR